MLNPVSDASKIEAVVEKLARTFAEDPHQNGKAVTGVSGHSKDRNKKKGELLFSKKSL